MSTTLSFFPSVTWTPAVAADDLFNRIRGEFLEMPGLRLTSRQAARLWSMDEEVARALLAALVATGFLARTSQGLFARRQNSW